ncbi:MAG: hypothetical protein EXR43_05265 [Dehalococcoidia bacterium]|nr:hypothetical protein [Dehalococcoidia bacterium]
MNLMRYTVVDRDGAVSFILHGDALPALLASCSRGPRTLVELLQGAEPYYHDVNTLVQNGLAVFDEHNTRRHFQSIHRAFELLPSHQQPAFRVVDPRTREESLRPVKAGVIVFNLVEQRIIQLENTYRTITRQGRGRVFDGERLTERTFLYRLPRTWAVVP